MGIAANAGHTLNGEVECHGGKASTRKEWDDERPKTAVDVERERTFLAQGEAGERDDVVDDAMGEVGSGTNEEDSVAVD